MKTKKIKPAHVWGWIDHKEMKVYPLVCGYKNHINDTRVTILPTVSILPTSDYKALLKELRELRKNFQDNKWSIKTIKGQYL